MQGNKRGRRVLSGVKPSAAQVHLGNYLGAMKRFVSLAKEHESVFCIVDLHALTSVKDGKLLREHTLSLTAAYLAIGLDPEKTILFKQSDIPEVCELTWYLSCQFPFGLLERAHALKDARAKEQQVNAGLAFYPILMAADILLYQADLIPVGADQKQHIEMTRDVAGIFNANYGTVFNMPEPMIESRTGIIPGLDGRKMSKSYNNYIGLFETEKKLLKKIRQIVTDSKTVEDTKDPEKCNVFSLYKFFATSDEQKNLAMRYRQGGMGYGEAKDELFRVVNRELAPIRARYQELKEEENYLKEILEKGALKARKIASRTMEEVRSRIGVKI